MSRIPTHTLEDAPPASKPLLESILPASPTGRPLNMQAEMAHSPAVLAGYVSLRRATEEHVTLEPKTRAAVMAAAASTLGVTYVEAITSMLATRAGWTPDEVAHLSQGHGAGDERIDSLLDMTVAAAISGGGVDDDVWDNALRQGWTTEQLTEVAAYVVIVWYSSFFVTFARTELDLPATSAVAS